MFDVVVNRRGQRSIWFVDRTAPDGWVATGFTATKAECLTHVDEEWAATRPGLTRPHDAVRGRWIAE